MENIKLCKSEGGDVEINLIVVREHLLCLANRLCSDIRKILDSEFPDGFKGYFNNIEYSGIEHLARWLKNLAIDINDLTKAINNKELKVSFTRDKEGKIMNTYIDFYVPTNHYELVKFILRIHPGWRVSKKRNRELKAIYIKEVIKRR